MAENQQAEAVRFPSSRHEGVTVLEAEVERNGRIECPVCGFPIGAVRGSKSAICGNCGFKDGCC